MAGGRSPLAPNSSALDVEVRGNIREVLADLREFDRKAATATRRKMRQAGDDAIAEMRSILAEPPPGNVSGVKTALTRRRLDGTVASSRRIRVTGFTTVASAGRRSRGKREQVAAQLKPRLVTGQTRQTFKITGSGGPFARAYNMPYFRHPVFGSGAWATQAGRPYFGAVVLRHSPQIRSRIMEALDEAIDAMADHGSPVMDDL